MAVFLKFNKIVVDNNIQVRSELSEERISEFMEIFDKLPPIKVVETENGEYYLADGFHRHEAAKRKKESGCQCDIVKGDLKKALEIAIEANCLGPLSLSREEKRNLVDKTLRFFTERANSWIAEMIGVSMQLVDSRRSILENDKVIRKYDKLDTRDGRSYPREVTSVKPANNPDNDTMDLIQGRGKMTPSSAPVPKSGLSAIDDIISKRREETKFNPLLSKKVEENRSVKGKKYDDSMFVDGAGLISTAVSDDGIDAIGLKNAESGGYMLFLYEFAGDRFFPSSSVFFTEESINDFLNKVNSFISGSD